MSKIISKRKPCFSLILFLPIYTACSAKNNTIPESKDTPSQTEPTTEIEHIENPNNEDAQSKDETTNNNSSDKSSTDKNQSPAPPRIKNNTQKLVKEGILEEVPSTVGVGEEFTITFRTMYPNGCWMQSEPSHDLNIETKTIIHRYTTSYEAEGRMCTMGFKQGGFQVKLSSNEVGTFEGKIFVDDNIRTSYTIDVISK